MAKPEGRPGPDFAVILNTDSGDGDEGASPGEIERLFTERDCEVRIFSLRAGGNIADAVSKAIASGAKCVVAAGGDGTICGVAGALVGTDVELGVIPLGTFNYFARGCGIPQEVDEAVDAVCCGTSRPINLGSINGEVFLNNASLGLYAAILARREGIYRKWGRSRLAAYWSVLATMATVHRPLTMRITIDGEVRRDKSPMIFVAVSAYQLDEFGIEGADAIRSGEFAVLLAPNCGRFRLIWKALLIALHGVQEGRDFKLLTGKNVVVETRRSRALVARDGERERMTAPFTFRLLEEAIQLRVPDPEKPTDAAP